MSPEALMIDPTEAIGGRAAVDAPPPVAVPELDKVTMAALSVAGLVAVAGLGALALKVAAADVLAVSGVVIGGCMALARSGGR